MPHTEAITKLKNDLVAMGEMCEYSLLTAIMSLVDRDSDLAYYVLEYDTELDELELRIDETCQQLLQGGSLSEQEIRFVMASAKINNDLERIGDLAGTVCEHVLFLVRERSVLAQVIDFNALVEQASEMIRESINALLERDTSLAWKIIDERLVVHEEAMLVLGELMEVMKADPRTIERCCHLLFIVQALQRVADQAANIAEEVVFIEEGVNIRHHIREYHPIEPSPFGEVEPHHAETKAIQHRPSREEIRARSNTQIIERETVKKKAVSGRHKASKTRAILIKKRAEQKKLRQD